MGTDEQVIRTFFADWFEATANNDFPRLRSMMADDVVFLTRGRPPFGIDEFEAGFKAGRHVVRLECSGELEEIVIVGELAYTRARLRVTVTPLAGGASKRLSGYTLSVFRKLRDGRWVIARDANLLDPEPEAT
jgi:uncharacterized protein (TIGR02246 family)